MLRRLFAIVSLVSLTLCVSIAALWGVSYAVRWEVAGESIDADQLGRTRYSVDVECGGIELQWLRFTIPANMPANFKK
jgi:hypothetical protein